MLPLISCEHVLDEPDLSDEEVVSGLKEALRVSTDTSVAILNKKDGYFGDNLVKILLPTEADVVVENISLIGGQSAIDEVLLLVNRSAEDAASHATPIFMQAITDLTIEEGWVILNGPDSAATIYLKEKTSSLLYQAFKPSIESSLSTPLIDGMSSAEEAYASLINSYNDGASLGNSLGGNYELVDNNSLTVHVTEKALDGLFIKIAEEEKAIRTEPFARVTKILEKVFSE